MKLVYKFLEVDNHQAISAQMYDFVVNHTEVLKLKTPLFFTDVDVVRTLNHVPLLKNFLQERFLAPNKISVIVVTPDVEPYLHVDTVDSYVRLLWPLYNCAGSKTKFYDIPREYLTLEFNSIEASSIYYKITEQRDWPSLGEVELTQPVVFDASIAHAVHIAPNATEYRISFTIGFDRDLPISKSVKAWFGFRR